MKTEIVSVSSAEVIAGLGPSIDIAPGLYEKGITEFVAPEAAGAGSISQGFDVGPEGPSLD